MARKALTDGVRLDNSSSNSRTQDPRADLRLRFSRIENRCLSAPLQDGLRFFRHPLPPPPSPSLRSEYRLAAGRVGLTLLSNVERRMGRLRPIVRRVMMPPSSKVPIDDPTRMPFWRRPVSTFGRFSMTDLDHGRSLAFSLPSSAGPPPEWCSRIVAVVPGASHGGLLLRMSG